MRKFRNIINLKQPRFKSFIEFIYGDSSLPKFYNAKSAYEYIIKKNQGRQEEIESYLVEDPEYAYKYAKNILKGRWEQAEPYIRDSLYADLYEKNVLHGDWPEIKPETDTIANFKNRDVGRAHILPVR